MANLKEKRILRSKKPELELLNLEILDYVSIVVIHISTLS